MDELQRRKRREEARRRLVRQRRIAAASLICGLGLVGFLAAGTMGGDGGDERRAAAGSDPDEPAKPKPPPELPRGGRRIFPDFRIVGFYGAPQDDALGALGIGSPAKMASRLRKQAGPYKKGRGARPILPAFELIATIASGAPGKDNSYSFRQPAKVIDRYLAAARREKALLVLDIQPGRVDFMREVRWLRRWLEQPDVALALDPEWRVGPGQIPGKVIGTVSADEVNRVTRYVRGIVRRKKLPQKLLLIHQFTDDMIPDKERLIKPRELAMTINVDGFGDQPNKIGKYEDFASRTPSGFHHGFKLFYEEDTNLMSPKQVMRLRPRPEIVVYE